MKNAGRLSDIRVMTEDQLNDEALKLKKEQFNLRFQKASGQLQDTARVRVVRRDIARVMHPSPRRSAPRRRPRTKLMPKRILQGVVVSDKQEKTLVIKVERRFTHPLLKKTVRKSKNYHAHVENKTQKVGDTVSIEETRPISKLKRWIVVGETAPKA